jgi:iron complex outermembrane recepter protein
LNAKNSMMPKKTPLRRVALAVSVAPILLSGSAFAQGPEVHTYHLSAGPLGQTLLEIAKESGTLVSFEQALVQSLKSAPVDGDFTADQAIDKALQGTGLERVTTPSGAITVHRIPATAADPNGAPAAQATDAASSSPVLDATLPLVSVAAQRDSGGNGYVTSSSSTLARSDTPIALTPSSISVVNAAAIQAQGDQSLTQILQNVAGVVARPGPLGVPTYAVRGFQGADVLTNGMQSTVNGEISAASLTPTIAIASVEVLKGPAAILAGDAPAGGVINIVKKTPQADPFHEVQFSYGKYGDVTGSFDSTGALTSDGKLMYRFILSDQQVGQNQGGYDGTHSLYFAPTIEYKDQSTDITVGYNRTVSSEPVPAYTIGKADGGFLAGGFDHPLGNNSDGFTIRQDDVFYNLEQKIDNHITFVSKADYTDAQQLQRAWTPVTTLSSTNEGVFMGFDTGENIYNLSLENYVRAKYDLGPIKTTTLFGWDYEQSHYNEFEYNDGGEITVVPNPLAPPSFPNLTSQGSGLSGVIRGTVTDSGLFLQEQANYGGLHVLGSIRDSEYWEDNEVTSISNNTSTSSVGRGLHQNAWTPNIGLLYQLTEDISAYANYMHGYEPNNALTFTGVSLAPENSKQVEVGLKGSFLDDKLSVTASAYRISYENQYVSDPEHPGYYLPAGGAVSRGFELEVTGQIAKGLNVIGNYTYNDYVQPYAPTVHVNLPHNTASLWATYNFQNQTLNGLGVGMGLYYAGGQAVGSTGDYRIPSQVETDVSVFYRHKKFGLNLSVKNVFNRNLYYSSTSSDYIPMGPTRTVLLTGTYDF